MTDAACYLNSNARLQPEADPRLWQEALTAKDARLRNALCRSRRPWAFELPGDRSARLYCRGPKASDRAPCSPVARLDLGGIGLDLCCDAAVLARAARQLMPEVVIAEDTVERIFLWLEYAFLALIERLEAALGEPVTLRSATTERTCTPVAFFELELDDDSFFIPCAVGAAHAEAFAALLARFWPARTASANAVPLAARWIGGHQDLTLAELRSLRRGDAVMLVGGNTAQIVIGDHLTARAAGDRPQLLTALQPMIRDGDIFMAEPSEPEESDEAHDPESGADQRLDDIAIRLTCQLGRLDMPLRDVRELGEGSVLALDKPPESAVDILLNGRRMGRGSLVRIGESIGVRIDVLNLDE